MSIHDQDNITLLIGILETEFNRQSVRRPNFVDFFNNKLKNYHERRFNYRDLQDMNKNLLSDCFQYIHLKGLIQRRKLWESDRNLGSCFKKSDYNL